MAFLSFSSSSSLFILTTVMTLLPSHSLSLTCKPQANLTNCGNLHSLNATLSWTYEPAATPNPTLTILFSAPPPSANGWVSWALNPISTGMIGAQALVAFKDPKNSSIVVKTYNITSYAGIKESAIDYNVLTKRGEYSGGVMSIFATLELPRGGKGELNQVWQVGPGVGSDGVPLKHAFTTENLKAMGLLSLAGNRVGGSPSPAPAPAPSGQSGRDNSGGSGLKFEVFSVYVVLLLLGMCVLLV